MVDFRNEPSCDQFRTVLALAATSFPYFLKKLLKKVKSCFLQCVVLENIQNPHGVQRKFRGEGRGVQKETISKGVGGCLQRYFQGV